MQDALAFWSGGGVSTNVSLVPMIKDMQFPPLTLLPTTHNTPQKPVVLLLPTGGVCEFGSLENAQSYLSSAVRVGAPGAAEAALFSYDFECQEWRRVV